MISTSSASFIGNTYHYQESQNLLILFVAILRNSITWEKAEGLKQEHCYIAEDYNKELSIFEVGFHATSLIGLD